MSAPYRLQLSLRRFVRPHQRQAEVVSGNVHNLSLAPGLHALPNELVERVGEAIADARDLHALSLINRRFHELLLPTYFVRADLDIRDSSVIYRPHEAMSAATVCQTFLQLDTRNGYADLDLSSVKRKFLLSHVCSDESCVHSIFADLASPKSTIDIKLLTGGKNNEGAKRWKVKAIAPVVKTLDFADEEACGVFLLSGGPLPHGPLITDIPDVIHHPITIIRSGRYKSLQYLLLQNSVLFKEAYFTRTLQMLNASALLFLDLRLWMTVGLWSLVLRLSYLPQLQRLKIESWGQLAYVDLAQFLLRHPSIRVLELNEQFLLPLEGYAHCVQRLTEIIVPPQIFCAMVEKGSRFPALKSLELRLDVSQSRAKFDPGFDELDRVFFCLAAISSPTLTHLYFAPFLDADTTDTFVWYHDAIASEEDALLVARMPNGCRPERLVTGISSIEVRVRVRVLSDDYVQILAQWLALFPSLKVVQIRLHLLDLRSTEVIEAEDGKERYMAAESLLSQTLRQGLPGAQTIRILKGLYGTVGD